MRKNVALFLALIWIFVIPIKADIRRDCRKESKVSWGTLKKLKAGHFEQNDQKLKCYVRCFMTRSGILTSDNKINIEKALRHLPRSMQDSSRKLFNQCKSVSGKDPCDTAFQIANCYVKSYPEIVNNVPFV